VIVHHRAYFDATIPKFAHLRIIEGNMTAIKQSAQNVNPDTSKQVIEEIYQNIEQGMGIVPLLGSGLSAASGIPAGIDYRAYLFYCLARVFGTDGESDKSVEQWDPRTLRWPDITEIPLFHNVRSAMLKWAKTQLKEVKKSPLGYHDARWQAAGAVADWRAILNLLSRLTIQEKTKKDGKGKAVVQTYSDQRIIDSFFVHLTNNRHPNSAYLLLAHLADILRIKVILTTNFDNLIESAFQSFSMPVAVYDVHMDAQLPDADFVRAQRSIIKIHGGRYGLRADFSLDKYPTSDDVDKFIAYLSLYDKNYVHIDQNQRNLLVIGVSGNERRTIALICRAMNHLKRLKIFWICHRESEITEINNSFTKTLTVLWRRNEIKYKDIGKCIERLRVTAFPSPALFFLKLYQKIFLSLPPAGVKFPAVWTMPPRMKGKIKAKDEKLLKNCQQQVENFKKRIIFLEHQKDLVFLSACLYQKLSENYHCIWVDLSNPFHTEDLAFIIIEAIGRELGIMNLLPINIKSGAKGTRLPLEFRNQIRLLVQNSLRRLVIFINCNDLTDVGDFKRLQLCLQSLQSDHISYILVKEPARKNLDPTLQISRNRKLQKNLAMVLASSKIMGIEIMKEYNKRSFMKKKIRKPHKIDIERFVLALTLFRQPCYLSVLHTWAFIKAPESLSTKYDNDVLRNVVAQVIISRLLENELIQESVGQFVSIPLRDRGILRKKIEEVMKKRRLPWEFYEAECHQGIADWYMKLYRASGDIRAVFECMFHRLQCYTLANKHKDYPQKLRLQKTSLVEGEQALKLIAKDIDTLYHSFSLGQLFDSICGTLFDLHKNESHNWFKWKLAWLLSQLKLVHVRYQRQIGFAPLSKDHILCGTLEPLKSPLLLDKNLLEIFRGKEKEFLSQLQKCGMAKKRTVVPSEELIDQLFENIGQNIHQRKYGQAEKIMNAILHYFEFDPEISKKSQINKKPEYQRSQVRKWIEMVQDRFKKILEKKPGKTAKDEGAIQEQALRLCQDLFKLMVRVLRRNQSLKYHKAQVLFYFSSNSEDFNKILRSAEITYLYSTEIMRYITDTMFLNRENAYLRTSTGIIMAKMDRHHEAYRRFNEAYGYLNFVPIVMQSEYVPIDLNRGETFLHLLSRNTPSDATHRRIKRSHYLNKMQNRRLGFLFDAIASVERAESRLHGTTVNNWLYSSICEMQLMICLETVTLRHEISKTLGQYRLGPEKDKYDLFSRCRECEMCGTRFIKNLENGLQMVGDDVLRLGRFMEIAFLFRKALHTSGQHSNNRRLKNSFQTAVKKGMHRLGALNQHVNQQESCKDVVRYCNKILGKKSLYLTRF
jgi:hypothetical protein